VYIVCKILRVIKQEKFYSMTELPVQIYNMKWRLSRGGVKYFAFGAKYFTIRKSLRVFNSEIREIREFSEIREVREFSVSADHTTP
jgi:hypothetical protein